MTKPHGDLLTNCGNCFSPIGSAHPFDYCESCKNPLPSHILNRIKKHREGKETPKNEEDKSPRGVAKRHLRTGLLWFFGGLVFTFGTFILASEGGGGVYAVFWGPVLFGAFKIARGIVGLFANPK